MKHLATFFLGLGVAIGVAGSIGLAVGFRPSELPAALLDISVYKLVFVAAGCVLAAGALIRRAERRHSGAVADASGSDRSPKELTGGSLNDPMRMGSEHEQMRERR